MSNNKKNYRKAYDLYITNTFGYLHDVTKIDEEYEKAYWLWKPYFESFLKKYDRNKSRVLDLGSGMGHNLYFFKKMGFKKIEGIDISKENIAFLKKKGFLVIKSDIFSFLEKNRNKYDVISLFDVIEHFTKNEILELLQLIKKSLSKNGVLLIHTLNASYPFFGKNYFWDITHELAFTTQSLNEFLLLSNFRNNKIFTINGIHRWHPNFFTRIARRIILGIFSTFTEYCLRVLALSQGVFLSECKPTLIAICYNK